MSVVKSINCFGIYPADIIIRSAVQRAFAELREQPWLLEFAFQTLLLDELTVDQYGAKQLEAVRDWFLENDVKITLGYKINNISIPHVAIWLGEQTEAEATTGDVHDIPQESIPWIMAVKPLMTFTAAGFDRATGLITLPADKDTSAIFIGMSVVDRSRGRAFQILDVTDEHTIQIAADQDINLTNAQIVGADSLWRVNLESIANRETFHIDVVVQGDAVKCIVLYGLLRWSLNRGKQRLLEARGFERSTLNGSGVMIAADGDNAAQIMFKRTLTLTGFTREYWPKDVKPPVQGISLKHQAPAEAPVPNKGLMIASGGQSAIDEDPGWHTIDD